MIMPAYAQKMKDEMRDELTRNIFPFWMHKTIDSEFGGFAGQIDGRGNVVKGAPKGGILNARILWTFSAAFNALADPVCMNTANYSMNFCRNHFFDNEYKGTYWKISYDGNPADTKKQIYSQAFFVYALSEYFKATGDEQSLNKAIDLFHLIEEKSFDNRLNGYFEAYSRDWQLIDDLRLSDKDANEKKTTNTHLHILEAYTNLYRAWKDKQLEEKLMNLTNLFLDRIIDPVSHHLLLFFDEEWHSRSTLISYGHDIEASWLVYEAATTLNNKLLIAKAKDSCTLLAKASLEGLQPDGSMIYERDDSEGIFDTDRHWWPQAETLVGLVNLYEITADETWLQKASQCWDYISKNLIDKENGEWYWSIRDGKPNLDEDKAGFWKCPYHNARACLEIIKRL